MTRSHLLSSILFHGVITAGCTATSGPGDATDTSTSSSSSTNPNGNESGWVTSAAEGGATTSGNPTMVTTMMTTSSTSEGSSSTGEIIDCDVWAQDCPEGQKCTPYIAGGGSAWDAIKCVDVTGTDKPGDECTSEGAASGIDSCIEGAMCWGVDMDGVGTCVELCSGTPRAPVCATTSEGCTGSGVLNLCFDNCDPLLQDCKNNNDVCYPINTGFTCAPDASGEEGQENDVCEFINVCDKGLACIDAAVVGAGCMPPATGCCSPMCDTTEPNPCNVKNNQECVPFFDPMAPPFPGAEIYGVCGVPA